MKTVQILLSGLDFLKLFWLGFILRWFTSLPERSQLNSWACWMKMWFSFNVFFLLRLKKKTSKLGIFPSVSPSGLRGRVSPDRWIKHVELQSYISVLPGEIKLYLVSLDDPSLPCRAHCLTCLLRTWPGFPEMYWTSFNMKQIHAS